MMKRRLYFMLPNVASAERTADDMLLARIDDRHMHFMAKPGTHLGKLHEAGYSIRNDLLRGAEVGLVSGALFGLVHSQQLGGAWAQVTLLVVVGMILTYIRARTGSVVASYLVHLGYNSILFVGFYVATSGLRNLPGPS